MIKSKDASKLALTKYKQRKFRTFLIGFSISLGIIILLVFIIGTAGFNNTLKKIFRDTLSFNNYVAVSSYADSSVKSDIKDKYNGKYSGKVYGLDSRDTHVEFTISPIIDQEATEYTYIPRYSLIVTPEFIAHDYLADGYSFEDDYDGKIPVIIPITDLAYLRNDVAIWELSAEEQYNFYHDLSKEYLGKEISILYQLSDIELYKVVEDPASWSELEPKFVIAGFSFPGFGAIYYLGYYGSLIIPEWAEPILAESDSIKATSSIKEIYKLENPKDVKKVCKDLWVDPVFGIIEQTQEFSKIIRNIGLGIGAFFLLVSAFSVFFTVNKIVSDSKREIGVFRAVGATRADIRKILYKYALLITNIGFVIALIIALGFNSLISILWGNSLFYTLAVTSMQMSVAKPALLFVGFPIINIVVIYCIGLLTTFIGTTIPAFRASRMSTVNALRDE